jgi:hypothetical protein
MLDGYNLASGFLFHPYLHAEKVLQIKLKNSSQSN